MQNSVLHSHLVAFRMFPLIRLLSVICLISSRRSQLVDFQTSVKGIIVGD
jgi:hypothetical protein